MKEWSLFGYLFHLFYLTPEEICRECMAIAPIPPAPEPIIERIVERIETVRFVEREYSLSESSQLVLAALWKMMYTREAILIAAISTTIIAAAFAAWTLCSRWTKRHNNTRPLHMTLSDSGGRHRYVPAVPNGNIAAPIDDPLTPYPVSDTASTPSATPGPHLASQCPPITINTKTTFRSSTFNFNDQSYQLLQEFLAIRQEVDESVASFAKRLEDTAKIGLAHMPEAGREFMLYRGFIDGIKDETLREELTKFRIYSGYAHDNERPSMTKVVNMAVRFEKEVLQGRKKDTATDSTPNHHAPHVDQPLAITYQQVSGPPTISQLTTQSQPTQLHKQQQQQQFSFGPFQPIQQQQTQRNNNQHRVNQQNNTQSPPTSNNQLAAQNSTTSLNASAVTKRQGPSQCIGMLRICDAQIPFRPDTGADVTLISHEVYKNIRDRAAISDRHKIRLHRYHSQLETPSGHLEVFGEMRTTVKIGELLYTNQRIVVAKMPKAECLLGKGMLQKCPEYRVAMKQMVKATISLRGATSNRNQSPHQSSVIHSVTLDSRSNNTHQSSPPLAANTTANNARKGLHKSRENTTRHKDTGTLHCIDEESDCSQRWRYAVPTHQLTAYLANTRSSPYGGHICAN